MSGPESFLPRKDKTDQRPPILVVGGTGHVGAALCNFLLARGHQVTAASRSDRLVFPSPIINRLQLDVVDTTDSGTLPRLTTAIICPWVRESDETESQWIGHLLQRLATAGYRSVIYFSTMWVYGAPPPQDLLSESTPTAPTSAYGTAHLMNESVLTGSAKNLGLDVLILRLANLVGPDPFFRFRSKISFAHELVAMAIADRAIVLRSPPSTPRNLLTRTLLHRDLEPLLDRNAVEGRVDIFNLGGGSTTTMEELARQVANLVKGYDGRTVRVEHPEESVAQPTFHLDTRKIRSLAGPGIDNLTGELQLVLEEVVRSHIPVGEMSEP